MITMIIRKDGAMKLITWRGKIRNVAKSWAAQYRNTTDASKKEVLAQLKILDTEKATIEDVAQIIGNDSWTRLICDECGEAVQAVVMVGQEPDYDSATVYLCKSCALKVQGLFV